MTWCPQDGDVTDKLERKWWGEKGTCQQLWMVKVMNFPPAETWTSTLPIPSIMISVPKAIWWTLLEGTYVVKRERSLTTWEGRTVSMMKYCGVMRVVKGGFGLSTDLPLWREDTAMGWKNEKWVNICVVTMSKKREKNKIKNERGTNKERSQRMRRCRCW